MPKVTLYKASPLGKRPVEDTTIEISGDMPANQGMSLSDYKRIYKSQADLLADALINSLPSGTMHRLLIRLLENKASYYRGPETD